MAMLLFKSKIGVTSTRCKHPSGKSDGTTNQLMYNPPTDPAQAHRLWAAGAFFVGSTVALLSVALC
jgi:hypothetical protein